jgi:hypothetical protein
MRVLKDAEVKSVSGGLLFLKLAILKKVFYFKAPKKTYGKKH